MVVARSTRETFDYVPMADRKMPKEQQSTFHLRRFPTHLALRSRSLIADGKEGELSELVLRAGVAGWMNYIDDTGKPAVYSADKGVRTIYGCDVVDPMTIQALDLIEPSLAGELGSAALTGNALTEEDVKN